MNKTLHKLAAHCAPPAPGVLRALVPGVLCGWGCAGLLATVAVCANEIRYLLPTFLLAVPSALCFALEGGVPDDQTKGVSEPCR